MPAAFVNATPPLPTDPPPSVAAPLPVDVAAALLGTRDPARLAAFLGRPRAQVDASLASLPPPAEADDDPHARDDARVLAWFAEAPARAARDVEAAIVALAAAGERARASHLAARHGDRAAQRRLLREHGWTLLLSSGRETLDALMATALAGPEPVDEALHALHLAWLVEGARLPHEAERRWRERPLADAGLQALLESRGAQMYDDPAAASRLGAAAVAALPEGPHPAAALARFAWGVARLDAGHPMEAQAGLAAALRGATRDGLAVLQVDALHALGWVHEEQGEDAEAAACVARALDRAREAGLLDLHAVDSARRLAALQALRRLAWGAPRDEATTRALASVQPGHPFPVRLLAGLEALLEGRVAAAREVAATLDREARESYQPRKWRVTLSWLQVALAGRAGRGDELSALVRGVDADRALARPDDGTLLDLHAGLVAIAAARLGGMAVAADAAVRLDAALAARGLARLRARLALLRALDPDTQDAAGACLAWARDPAADPLDAVMLAPRAVGPLSRLALDPRLGADVDLAARIRGLLRRLQAAPAPVDEDAADTLPPSRPPQDLTEREWDVMRLIARQLTNEQIAVRLGVSVATVKTHINRAYAKLGVASRAEAAQRARALEAG